MKIEQYSAFDINTSIIYSSHANLPAPPEVVVTDTAASSTTERFESTTSSGQQITTQITETVVTKTSGYSSTVVEVINSIKNL